MSSGSRSLTSRNLFDAVLSAIPKGCTLFSRPPSVHTLPCFAVSLHARHGDAGRLTGLGGGGGDDDDDEYGEFVLEDDDAGPSGGTRGAAVDEFEALGLVDVADAAARSQDGPAPDDAREDSGDDRDDGAGAGGGLQFNLDLSDVAAQQATKYAATVAKSIRRHGMARAGASDSSSDSGGDDGDVDEEERRRERRQKERGEAVSARRAVTGATQRFDQATLRRTQITPEQQLRLMPPDGDGVFEGCCMVFNRSKGFGFVAPDVGGPDLYSTRESLLLAFSRRVLKHHAYLHQLPLPPLPPIPSYLEGSAGGDHAVRRMFAALEGSTDGEQLARFIAQRLTPKQSELLRMLVILGRPFLVQEERVSFTVKINRAGGSNRRKLRADCIKGCETVGAGRWAVDALWVERELFAAFITDYFTAAAARAKQAGAAAAPTAGSSTGPATGGGDQAEAKGPAGPPLPPGGMAPPKPPPSSTDAATVAPPAYGAALFARYIGTLRAFNDEQERGYLRPEDDVIGSDVLTYGDAFIWDDSVDPAHRVPGDGMRVRFSVAGRDRAGKPLAILVTALDDRPLNDGNITWAEAQGQRVRESNAGYRKRVRGDEELLLLEEHAYGAL